jgi:hypothetical protein
MYIVCWLALYTGPAGAFYDFLTYHATTAVPETSSSPSVRSRLRSDCPRMTPKPPNNRIRYWRIKPQEDDIAK